MISVNAMFVCLNGTYSIHKYIYFHASYKRAVIEDIVHKKTGCICKEETLILINDMTVIFWRGAKRVVKK